MIMIMIMITTTTQREQSHTLSYHVGMNPMLGVPVLYMLLTVAHVTQLATLPTPQRCGNAAATPRQRHGNPVAWHGMALHGMAWHGMAWHGA